jgi:hypothetical protein
LPEVFLQLVLMFGSTDFKLQNSLINIQYSYCLFSPGIHRAFTEASPQVHRTFTAGSPDIHRRFTGEPLNKIGEI